MEELLKQILAKIEALDQGQRTLAVQLGSRIDTIDNRMGVLEGHMEALNDRMGALEGHVEALTGRIGTLEGHVEALNGRMGTMGSHMEAMDSRMGALESHMEAMDGRMVVLEGHMETLGNRIDKLELRIENEVIEKIRALYDAREVQNDINERIIVALNRIEAKVDVLQMETSSIRRIR